MKTKTLLAALAALILAAVPAAASDLWLHVTVRQAKGDHANVTVNLPISVVEKALPLIPQDAMQNGRVVIEDADFDARQLRDVWQEVKNSPDMTFATVKTDNESVKVYKERGYLMARTTEARETGTQVHARIPLSVVDALLSGDANTLNIQAAIQALAAEGEGELVTVQDGSDNVRVWVDSTPEAE
jgi:hypothetical protein